MIAPRHFLEVDDLTPDELVSVLDLALVDPPPQILTRQGVALLFEKPSLRTRNSTELAVVQLGGHPLTMRAEEIGIGGREPASDIARVLAGYHAAIAARVFDHGTLVDLAAASPVPVVNLLSDRSHPCQALADLLTLRRRFGRLDGLTVAYVGDFNNVARSLGIALAMSGAGFRVGCPAGYGPDDADVDHLRTLGGSLETFTRPGEAVAGCDAVYTDVWTSMGQEQEAEARRRAFEGFTVDAAMMAEAAEHAIFLHCLPAHRGEEVAAEVVDGPRSAVVEQAHDRMHAVRGLLLHLLGGGSP